LKCSEYLHLIVGAKSFGSPLSIFIGILSKIVSDLAQLLLSEKMAPAVKQTASYLSRGTEAAGVCASRKQEKKIH
jgi:hypothetical protein